MASRYPGADGFNLADVGSVSELNALPPGVKVLSFTLVSQAEPTLFFKPPSANSSAIRTCMASTLLMSLGVVLPPILKAGLIGSTPTFPEPKPSSSSRT